MEEYENICKKCLYGIVIKQKMDIINSTTKHENIDGYFTEINSIIKNQVYCNTTSLSRHLVVSDDDYPIIECESFKERR